MPENLKPEETDNNLESETSDDIQIAEAEVKSPDINSFVKNRPRKVYGGMWGPMEMAFVGAGALAIVIVIAIMFFVVFPAQKEYAQSKILQDQLDSELSSAKVKYGSVTNTQAHVGNLLKSVNDFETSYLPSVNVGRSALYERLNGLIASYGLVNVSGPDYQPLGIIDPQRRQQPENERGRDKLMSLFPGDFVTVTVEGSYQSLRRFIREIETGQQFIMISSVELVPADKQKERGTEDQAQQIKGGEVQPNNVQNLEEIYRGKMHGENVSLKIEMAAYFRRSNYTPLGTEVSAR